MFFLEGTTWLSPAINLRMPMDDELSWQGFADT